MASTAGAAPMTPQQIAEAFLKAYSATFSSAKRADLAAMYQDASTFSFEGTTLKGKAAIAGALGKIPIAATEKHRFVTSDLQPSPSAGALLCMVTGDIAKQKFTQVFQLVPTGTGSYYIHNDVFRAGGSNPMNAPKELGGEVAAAFVQHYYATFDGAKRGDLVKLYGAGSMLTFEDKSFKGPEAILKRLGELPATTHTVTSLDLQQVSGDTKVLLCVATGKLKIEGSTNELFFSQAFQLVQNGTSYYVHNDIFRLNYG